MGFINRFIYTNICLTNFIVKINPKDGKIVGKLDLTPYADDAKTIYPQALDIDGIAHDSVGQKFLITGKLWPEIYELNIDLIEELPTIVNPQ